MNDEILGGMESDGSEFSEDKLSRMKDAMSRWLGDAVTDDEAIAFLQAIGEEGLGVVVLKAVE